MDCNHARLLLSFSHKKAELDTAEAEALQAHLEQCPECELLSRSERAIDEALGRAMNDVPVPDGLKERLAGKLAWVQRLRVRRTVRRALAASLLLAVGLGGYVLFFGRTELTWDDLRRLTYERGEIVTQANEPEHIERWFRDQGISMEAPRHFNYGLLKSFEVVRFHHRQVAKLVFARDDAMAEVYVLSDKDFNLKALRDDPEQETGSRFRAKISAPSEGYIFLMIFQGTLDPFLIGPSA
jgi:hypothetical protein